MASELKVDKIFNAGGDQDSGINLATNDTIKFDIATSTKATMASTGIVTIVGEGGTTTTNLQQGLAKAWVSFVGTGTISVSDSFNLSSLVDDDTGTYTANINNDMANDAYCWSVSMKDGTTQGRGRHSCPQNASTYSASAFQMEFQNDNSDVMQDVDHGALVITGDLA